MAFLLKDRVMRAELSSLDNASSSAALLIFVDELCTICDGWPCGWRLNVSESTANADILGEVLSVA